MYLFSEGYTGFFLAMASGWFGATFFMLALMQSNIEQAEEHDIRDLWSYPMILLRSLVGVGGAAILYFFFESGVLQGSLWPDLKELGFTPVSREIAEEKGSSKVVDTLNLLVPNRQTALLIIWSFLAGYSQTLVPNILVRTEGKSNPK